MGGVAKYVIETRQVLLINEDMVRRSAEIGAATMPGTDSEKSMRKTARFPKLCKVPREVPDLFARLLKTLLGGCF